MAEPIVSVVIPAYNRAASIRAAVDSARAQTLGAIEIIVVDDASQDETCAVVDGIDDPRVHLVRRARNGGAAAARNTGISHCRAAHIAFLDSDDVWFPDKLARQLALLQAPRAAAAVAVCGVEMHLLDHGIVRTQLFEAVDDWARRLAMGCDLSPGTTQLTRREAFDRIGPLDESLPRFEDWDWLLRYTRLGAIVGVPEALAQVCNRRARLGDHVAVSAMRFLAKHADVLASLAPADRRRAIADIHLQVVGTYAFEGRLAPMLPSIVGAARQRPLHTAVRLASGAVGVLAGRLRSRRT